LRKIDILGAIALALAALSLDGCSKQGIIDQAEIERRCSELSKVCKKGCSGGDFKACYVDTSLFGDRESYDVRKECHGVHVGNTCEPCKHIFSLNFGGAMREVSCKTFLEAIEKQDSDCGGCMKKVGWSPL